MEWNSQDQATYSNCLNARPDPKDGPIYLSPEKPECGVASLVLHHGHPDGVIRDDSKKNRVGKAPHE
jgi:hypothetical protein